MAVYRFRVFIEDDHEVYRDIEVQGRQHFADLHLAIVQSFNFQKGQRAEYKSSDQSWYEGDTVAELDGSPKGNHQKVSSHIFDPHQRFICVTESYKEIGLALELREILKEGDGISYPRSVKSEGEPPYYTQPPPEPIADEPEEEAAPADGSDALFDGEDPSEEDIDRFQQETEAAGRAGELKAPDIDLKKLQKQDGKAGDDGFEEFDMDDLM